MMKGVLLKRGTTAFVTFFLCCVFLSAAVTAEAAETGEVKPGSASGMVQTAEGTLSPPGTEGTGTTSQGTAGEGTLSPPGTGGTGTTSQGTVGEGTLSPSGTAGVATGELSPGASKGETLEEQGMLSAPDHPISAPVERMIFIGDSRTVGIMNAVQNAVQNETVWSCKISMGYDWMVSEGIPAVEPYIESNSAVIILMGVNDVHNISNYVATINQKAAEWAAKGAKTYYVAVGPVESDPYVTNAEIEAFNTSLQNNLIGVNYLDIYTYLTENGFTTLDGIHYPEGVSIAIYNYIVEHLETNRSGIWG